MATGKGPAGSGVVAAGPSRMETAIGRDGAGRSGKDVVDATGWSLFATGHRAGRHATVADATDTGAPCRPTRS
eukprot:6664361-Pyramimonas_sp.AAC.1